MQLSAEPAVEPANRLTLQPANRPAVAAPHQCIVCESPETRRLSEMVSSWPDHRLTALIQPPSPPVPPSLLRASLRRTILTIFIASVIGLIASLACIPFLKAPALGTSFCFLIASAVSFWIYDIANAPFRSYGRNEVMWYIRKIRWDGLHYCPQCCRVFSAVAKRSALPEQMDTLLQ